MTTDSQRKDREGWYAYEETVPISRMQRSFVMRTGDVVVCECIDEADRDAILQMAHDIGPLRDENERLRAALRMIQAIAEGGNHDACEDISKVVTAALAQPKTLPEGEESHP